VLNPYHKPDLKISFVSTNDRRSYARCAKFGARRLKSEVRRLKFGARRLKSEVRRAKFDARRREFDTNFLSEPVRGSLIREI